MATKGLNPNNLRVVLVLQGGGALGAFQAGVYQAMHEHGLKPDWIVGTSIGAINGALIAGNAQAVRIDRLRSFWDLVSHGDSMDVGRATDWQRRANVAAITADVFARGIPGFFVPRLFSGFPLGLTVRPEEASFYDTDPLASSLVELVDFDYLNAPGGMRLTINAVQVTTDDLIHFDSLDGRLTVDHIRASGALPPAFPPVRINGQLYWDGGLYSNTPLESVLDDPEPRDTLCFMVDLWSAIGPEPLSLTEVQTRQKDVMYAARSKRHIEDYVKTYLLQSKLRELYARLPAGERTAQDELDLKGLGCDTVMHVMRLQYRWHDWHMPYKDANFSKASIAWRWEQGYADASRAIALAPWLESMTKPSAVVVHELPPAPRFRRQSECSPANR